VPDFAANRAGSFFYRDGGKVLAQFVAYATNEKSAYAKWSKKSFVERAAGMGFNGI